MPIDERPTHEEAATPAEVLAHLHRWIEEDPERARRLGLAAVRRHSDVLEPGDALSIVHESAVEVAELAGRRPVFLGEAAGLVVHRLPWAARQRAQRLRPRREVPIGLGLDGDDPGDLHACGDELSAVLASRHASDLGEEFRSVQLLEGADRVARRARRLLPGALVSGATGADKVQLAALRTAAVSGREVPLGAEAALRQRMHRGRQAVARWLRRQARPGPEADVLAILMDKRRPGERGRLRAVLEWIGLEQALSELPAERLAGIRRRRTR